MKDRRNTKAARNKATRPIQAAIEPLENRQLFAATLWPNVTQIAVEGTAIGRTGTPITRSMVTRVSVSFDRDMSAGIDATDLQLRNLSTSRTYRGDDVTFAYDPASFTATWSFAGAAGMTGGSLPDGRYVALLFADGASVGQPAVLDGDANGQAGANLAFSFSRFFGDANGTGAVEAADQTAFNATLNKIAGDAGFDPRFDVDGDSLIGPADQSAFNLNFGKTLAAAKPATPTGLVATALPGGVAVVGWSAAPDATAVRLDRATTTTGPWTTVTFLSGGSTNFRQTGLAAGATYYYRLTSLSNHGSSAASTPVKLVASASPRISTNISRMNFADGVDGLTSAPKTVKVTNTGTGGLVINAADVTIIGTGAADFTVGVNSFPLVIGPGQSANLQVRMNASTIGATPTATLRIASNDVGKVVKTVALRGLGFDVTTRGPSVQQMLDYNGIPMTADVRPVGELGATTLNERALPLLAKAGTGPVTVQLLGVAALGSTSAEMLRLGYYTPGTVPTGLTPAFSITNADVVSVSPAVNGSTSFDPGGGAFGLYADFPGLLGRRSYTEDALNAFDTRAWARRKFRFYLLTDASGAVVDNAYLLTVEVNNVTFSRTIAMIIRNVRHANLPTGWRTQDLGTPALAGQATAGGGVYTVVGSGTGAASVNAGLGDESHFAYRSLTGNGTFTARLDSLSDAVASPLESGGIMFRASPADNSPFAGLTVGADGSAAFVYRTDTGTAATTLLASPGPGAGVPVWLRLSRVGNLITGFWSVDGVTWTQQGSATISLPSSALVGFNAASGDETTLATATFSAVSTSGSAAVMPTRISVPATAVGVVTVSGIATEGTRSGRLVVNGAYVGGIVNGDGPYSFSWDSKTIANGTYAVGIETVSPAGVTSRVTASVIVNNSLAAPEVWFPTIGTGEVFSGFVTLTSTAITSKPIAGVTYAINGVAVGATVTTAPYSFVWDSRKVANGWHTLTVTVRDTAGKSSTSTPVRVRVANGISLTALEIQQVTFSARRTEQLPWSTWGGQAIAKGVRLTGATNARSQWGGDLSRNVGGTGFFRVQKVNNRWWMVDPDGYLYFDNSVVAVEPQVFDNNRAEFESKFGPIGPESTEAWAAWVRGWLQDIGIYSASWATTTTLRTTQSPMNYSMVLQFMSGFAKTIGAARSGVGNSTYTNGTMPVFDPRFVEYCNNWFDTELPVRYPGIDPKNDPYLVGYMTDNELPWSTSTLDNYLLLPAGDANRAAAEQWLRNRAVNTPTDADRTDFLSYVAETYFRITSQAIKRYDPNHLNMGARFLAGDGQKTYLYRAAKPYIDIASVNYYDGTSPGSVLNKAQAGLDIPFMVTEFYAKGADSGLANRSGFGITVRTQADRGTYYQGLALSMLQTRNAVGVSWLTLMDNNESNTRADPSNTDANKGLMPITYPLTQADNPYRALTERIQDINYNLYELIKRLTP